MKEVGISRRALHRFSIRGLALLFIPVQFFAVNQSNAAETGESIDNTLPDDASLLEQAAALAPYFTIAGGIVAVVGYFAEKDFQNKVLGDLADIKMTLEKVQQTVDKCYKILSKLPELLKAAVEAGRYQSYIEQIEAGKNITIDDLRAFSIIWHHAQSKQVDEARDKLKSDLELLAFSRNELMAWQGGPLGYQYIFLSFFYEAMLLRSLGNQSSFFYSYRKSLFDFMVESAATFSSWAAKQEKIVFDSKEFWNSAEKGHLLQTYISYYGSIITSYIVVDGKYGGGPVRVDVEYNSTQPMPGDKYPMPARRNSRGWPANPWFTPSADLHREELARRKEAIRAMFQNASDEGTAADQLAKTYRTYQADCLALAKVLPKMKYGSVSPPPSLDILKEKLAR